MIVRILPEKVTLDSKLKKTKIKVVITTNSSKKLHSKIYKLDKRNGELLGKHIVEFDTKNAESFELRIFAVKSWAGGLTTHVIGSAEISIAENELGQCTRNEKSLIHKSRLYILNIFKQSKSNVELTKFMFRVLRVVHKRADAADVVRVDGSRNGQVNAGDNRERMMQQPYKIPKSGPNIDGARQVNALAQKSTANSRPAPANQAAQNRNEVLDKADTINTKPLAYSTPSPNNTESNISGMSKREWVDYINSTNAKSSTPASLSKSNAQKKYEPVGEDKFTQLFKKSMNAMGSSKANEEDKLNSSADGHSPGSASNPNQRSSDNTLGLNITFLDPLEQKLRQAQLVQDDKHKLFVNVDDLEGSEDETSSATDDDESINATPTHRVSIKIPPALETTSSLVDTQQVTTLMRMPLVEPTEEELGEMPSNFEVRMAEDGMNKEYYNKKTKRTAYIDPRKWKWALKKNLQTDQNMDSFIQKMDHYSAKMNFRCIKSMKDPLNLVVDRNELTDSAMALNDIDGEKLRSTNLQVKFVNEEGVDLNGVKKELITLLSNQVFHPLYGLFSLVTTKSNEVTINEFALELHPIDYIKLAARIMAISIIYRINLSIPLSPLFIKALFGYPFVIEDLRREDEALYESMVALKNGKAADFDLNFFYTHQKMDGSEEYIALLNDEELSKQPVTDENKDDYIRRFLKYRYLGCSNKIYKEFRKYLKEVIHSLHQMKMIFTPNEIVRMLCGEDHIDLEDMRNHSQCGGDLKTNPIILAHFWSFLCTCNQTQLSSILHFALGTFKTPSGGFRNLSIVNNVPMPLTLISNKGSDNLLTSRTCFNRVNLPFETNYEKFKRICVMCLESCMGFGTD